MLSTRASFTKQHINKSFPNTAQYMTTATTTPSHGNDNTVTRQRAVGHGGKATRLRLFFNWRQRRNRGDLGRCGFKAAAAAAAAALASYAGNPPCSTPAHQKLRTFAPNTTTRTVPHLLHSRHSVCFSHQYPCTNNTPLPRSSLILHLPQQPLPLRSRRRRHAGSRRRCSRVNVKVRQHMLFGLRQRVRRRHSVVVGS